MASFSISLGGGSRSRKPSPPAPRNGVKRAHAALDDAESEDEDVNVGKRQNITHFDISAGGAVDVSKPKVVKEALVIKPQANRDWKEASLRNKRQKYGLPSEEQEKAKQDFVAPKPSTSYGLNIHKSEAGGDSVTEETGTGLENDLKAPVDDDAAGKPKTDDERAIAALMGLKEESTLTIPAFTEDEALERDVKEAPNAPTLAEYAAVPVEEFGAAMLRGMGWKEGQGIGTQKGQKVVKSKIPERRPALLGIGAKPDAAVAAELGAWGAGAKGRKRVDIVYNPLILKNSKTGEQLTEDELKVRLQEQKEREANEIYARDSKSSYERREDKSSRRHRNDHYDSEEKEDRRRKERKEITYEDDKRRSKRERSISTDRHRPRRERSNSYDRAREKRRDKDYDRDDRKDRDRRRRDRDDYDRRERRRDYNRDDDERDRRYRR